MCVEINQSVFAKFLSAPGLAWQATLKKAKVEKLPVNGVKWLKIFLNLMIALCKVLMKKVMKDILMKLMFNTL